MLSSLTRAQKIQLRSGNTNITQIGIGYCIFHGCKSAAFCGQCIKHALHGRVAVSVAKWGR